MTKRQKSDGEIWLLTYTNCPLTLNEAKSKFERNNAKNKQENNNNRQIKEMIVSREYHNSGHYHFHAFISYDKRATLSKTSALSTLGNNTASAHKVYAHEKNLLIQ